MKRFKAAMQLLVQRIKAAQADPAPVEPPITIAIQGVVTLDGRDVARAAWPTIQALIDEDLAISL